MRILIFSDLHLHNHVYGSTTVDYDAFDLKGVNSRLVDGAKVLRDIYFYINDNPVDVVVFCGDLFHTHGKIDATVLKVAHEGMWRIKQHLGDGEMYALVGNHDTADKSMNIHAMHWLESVGVNVIDGAWHNSFNGLHRNLSFLAYTESKEEIEKFFEKAEAKGNDTVCFMHAGIDGVPMKSGFVPGSAFNTDMIPEGVKHVFSGHYHPHLRVTDKATVVGTPLQLNWADEGDRRGFLIYDTDSGEIDFHELDAPKFVTLNMKGMGVADYTYQEKLGKPGLFNNNFVRVEDYHSGYTEEIREGLMGAGARSVEFVVKMKEVDRLQPLSNDELHIPDVIKEYEEQKEVTPERSKVGEELRK